MTNPSRTPGGTGSPGESAAENQPLSTTVSPAAETSREDAALAETTAASSTPPARREAASRSPQRTVAGSTWVGLIVGALLLIMLLVFILQNQQSLELTLFAWHFTFPAGVGFLLAAIAGALIMALVGGVRMLQLKKELRQR